MSSTHVHVILSGIVSLIPGANNPPKRWTVRLHDERGAAGHPHFPSIIAERDNVTLAPKPSKCKKLPGGWLDAWMLDNGVISVKSKIVSSAIASPRPLPFVLAIEGACGGVANCPVAKAFRKRGVRLPVTRGSLETTELEGDQWQWDVSHYPPAWIAEEVCWHFEIRGTVLEIELPYRGALQTLKICAPAGGTPTKGGDIELRLQNTMDKDVFPICGIKPDVDLHANLYFDQASANPRKKPALLQRHWPVGKKPFVLDHNHRLTDSKIGTDAPLGGTNDLLSGANATLVSLRVNCPPAQWKG